MLIPWLGCEGIGFIAILGFVFAFFDDVVFGLSSYVYAVEVELLSLYYKALASETEPKKLAD